MRFSIIISIAIILSSCSNDDKIIGDWVTSSGVNYDSVLNIERTDSGLVFHSYYSTGIVKREYLTNKYSIQRKFLVGCMSYDIHYALNYSPNQDLLIATIIDNNYKGHSHNSTPLLLYRRKIDGE